MLPPPSITIAYMFEPFKYSGLRADIFLPIYRTWHIVCSAFQHFPYIVIDRMITILLEILHSAKNSTAARTKEEAISFSLNFWQIARKSDLKLESSYQSKALADMRFFVNFSFSPIFHYTLFPLRILLVGSVQTTHRDKLSFLLICTQR